MRLPSNEYRSSAGLRISVMLNTPMNLYEVIQHEMHTDDARPEMVSEQLFGIYEQANRQQRDVMNEMFAALTSWTFETLFVRAVQL